MNWYVHINVNTHSSFRCLKEKEKKIFCKLQVLIVAGSYNVYQTDWVFKH